MVDLNAATQKLMSSVKELTAEVRDDRIRLTDTILKQYAEINKGELIVTAGAFSLIVNFLIRDKSIQDPYSNVCLLKIAVVLLAITLVMKFLISRLSVDFATKEQEILDKRMDLYGKCYGLVLKFHSEGNQKHLLESRELFLEAEKVWSEFREEYQPFVRKYGKQLNWIEFILLSIGVVLLVIFFVLNV